MYLLFLLRSLPDGDDIFNLEQQVIASVIVVLLLSTTEYFAIITNAILRSICINQDLKKKKRKERLHGTHYTWGTAGKHKAGTNTEINLMKPAVKICANQMCSCTEHLLPEDVRKSWSVVMKAFSDHYVSAHPSSF